VSLNFNFKRVYDGFTLEAKTSILADGVTAIFGPSGAGKTSLLRFIAGLDKIEGGQLSFKNEIWQSSNVWLPPWQRKVAYVFQQPSLFTHLNVQANLDFASKRAVKNSVGLSQADITEMFDLGALLNRSVTTLSGGQQQRVTMARALCSRPQLLLMDEPLSALDNTSKKQIMPYLESLSTDIGLPIIYVSHAVREVARLADSVLLMNNGRIDAQGDLEQMLVRINIPEQSADVENLVQAKLVEYDAKYGLSILDSNIGRISVAKIDQPIGSRVRLILSARDVSLTLQHQKETSILNIFPAKIENLESIDQAQMLVKLSTNNSLIYAKITHKSAHNLALKVGLNVYCQAKAISLL